MRSAKFVFAAALLAAMLGLTACNILSDARSNTYENYESLVSAGEIERGWAPEFLPRSATDIHLDYDLDTNAVLLAFDFAAADLEALTQACASIDDVTAPALSAEWWPADLHADDAVSFFQCPGGGYLALDAHQGYYWSGSKTIAVAELVAHPKQYQHLDGQRVTVIGYVDFDNIHDMRETYYAQEVIGFVLKPGQTAEAVFFADFDPSLDPHPLFDRLYCLRSGHEAQGLQIVVTGTLHAFEMPTNFTTGLGYAMDVQNLDDVVILAAGCETPAASESGLTGLGRPVRSEIWRINGAW